ncbi:MAG: hypothetical protein ACRDG8_07125 [Actinomycetota bacterium]
MTSLIALASHDLALAAPRLDRLRAIRTTPFVNRNVSMRDNEGSAYVPRDRSLWLADDNGRAVYEVDPATGRLKRVIGRKAFEAARRAGGGRRAGVNRAIDFESIAYDRARDSLYVFSGSCCASSSRPTVFRLGRIRGRLRVVSYQPLPGNARFDGAGWNSANGKIYVAHGRDLRSYRYQTNALGRPFRVPGLGGITGMGFTPKGASLFVTTHEEKLRRVRWSTKRLVSGWTFDLGRFGIDDSRAVELIRSRYYVSDGADALSNADPLKYAVHVFRVR